MITGASAQIKPCKVTTSDRKQHRPLITCRSSARFSDSKMLEKQKDVDSFVISSGRDFHYGKTGLSWVIVRERKP